METQAQSASGLEILWGYTRERMPLFPFVPLAIFLATAGHVLNPTGGWLFLAEKAGLAWALVFQYRLADDLHNLSWDCQAHPARVLCRAPSLVPFRFVWVGLAMANLGWLVARDATWVGPIIFVGFTSVLALWYRLEGGDKHRLLTSNLVLLKYPVITGILYLPIQVEPAPSIWLVGYVLLSVFGVLALYEVLHDPAFRQERFAPVLAASEMGLLASLIAISPLLKLEFVSRAFPWGLTITTLLLYGVLFGSLLKGFQSRIPAWTVFLPTWVMLIFLLGVRNS